LVGGENLFASKRGAKKTSGTEKQKEGNTGRGPRATTLVATCTGILLAAKRKGLFPPYHVFGEREKRGKNYGARSKQKTKKPPVPKEKGGGETLGE